MSPQGYSYSSSAASSRHSSNHATSSAFSSSANPDEDWTQISDLAERRRIQNRIAQRNYRKKLKRRLEDLERRAGSSSESPPQVHAQLKPAPKKNGSNKTNKSRQQLSPKQNQYSPPMTHEEESIFDNTYARDPSRSPPLFYPSFQVPEDNFYSSYTTYRQSPVIQTSDSYDYMVPAPMTLPSMMQFTEGIKREPTLDDASMNPFSMSYAAMAGIDIQGGSHFDNSNAHTPPLSHSFEHSTTGSEIGFGNYPSTPLSIPASPGMMQLM